MSDAVLDAYNALSLEAQKEVEHLIYFLVSQQNKQSEKVKSQEELIDSFVGKCHSWNSVDALEYQKSLRSEERV